MQHIVGHIMAGGGSITWQVMRPAGWPAEREGLSLNFPFSGRPPTAREAKQEVADVLIRTSENWVVIKPKSWLVDLDKLKEKFGLEFDWLKGSIAIEPEYDLQPDTFRPEKLNGFLRIVIEKGSLSINLEPLWGEYPEDDLAELVPVLRRKAFDQDLSRLCETAEKPFSFLMIDIDHFKKVNDTWGHQIGDRALIRVAEIARDVIGRRGRVYRYGGEELAALLPEFTALEAKALAERIRTDIEIETWSRADGLKLTVSIGISEWASGQIQTELVQRADAALYKCKNEGRNRIAIAE